MALPPSASNQAFLREVDEELRREQLFNAGRRWGGTIAAAVIAALVVLGGWMLWLHHRDTARGETAEQLQAALDGVETGAPTGGAAPLAPIADGSGAAYRSIARFAQADVKLKAHDLKGAAAIFGSVVDDTGASPAFRNLALVRQTAAEIDTLPPATVLTRLRTLAVPGNPYFGSAGELAAIAYLRLGKPAAAAALFSQIGADENVPESIRQRAVQMAGVVAATTASPHQGNPTK